VDCFRKSRRSRSTRGAPDCVGSRQPEDPGMASRQTSRRLFIVIGSSWRSTRLTTEVILALQGAAIPICVPLSTIWGR